MRMPERSTALTRHLIGKAADIPPGESRIIAIAGREIGVFHTPQGFAAIRNRCPHMGAPLCLGAVTGTFAPAQPGEYRWEREGEILVCPWHAWEFDLFSGEALFVPEKRVKTYPVEIEAGDLYLYV